MVGLLVVTYTLLGVGPTNGQGQRLLLEQQPFSLETEEPILQEDTDPGNSTGIVFGEDTPSHPVSTNNAHLASGPDWSEHPVSEYSEISTSTHSDIFTDGNGDGHHSILGQPSGSLVDSLGAHVLHIQMSLYPMTLSQYLSPPSSASSSTPLRHCFHLIPTLRILLSILAGVQYIHSKGMMHRDIKPGNIFLSFPEVVPQGRCCDAGNWLNPRIGDFGLVAQLAREGLSADDSFSPHEVAVSNREDMQQPDSPGRDTRVGTG